MTHGYGFQQTKECRFIIGGNIIQMKNNFYIFVLFLFFSCFSEPLKKEVNYSKFLKLDIIQNFESDLESNVDLVIKFPIRNLVFKKVSNSMWYHG